MRPSSWPPPTHHATQSHLITEVHPQNQGFNPDLVIKIFDKGSGICFTGTSLYVSKIEEHLANSTYKELNTDTTQAIRKDVLSTFDYQQNNHQTNDIITRQHLIPPNSAHTPLFYGLPKVHKSYIPLQLKVSACDSPTNQLSNYVTHFIQPIMETIPSYIRDRRQLLQLLESFPPLPESVILVTADITSLYTNISHEYDIASILHYMKLHAGTLYQDVRSPHKIGILLEIILKNNNLPFMDKHFLQLVSPYINLFMGCHKQTTCEAFIWAILFWKRFIYDIFLIFLGTTNHLQSLRNFMSHLHLAIKFTYQHTTQQIFFLDMKIRIGADHKLSTTLYRKPTDHATLPHFYSNNSPSAKKTSFSHMLSDTTYSLQMITY